MTGTMESNEKRQCAVARMCGRLESIVVDAYLSEDVSCEQAAEELAEIYEIEMVGGMTAIDPDDPGVIDRLAQHLREATKPAWDELSDGLKEGYRQIARDALCVAAGPIEEAEE